MRRRIALTTLAGLMAALVLAQPAEACGGRKARKCGCHGHGRGHRGKYVTYNGAGYGTYPMAETYSPGYAPAYGPAPQGGVGYAPASYNGGMMPPPPPPGA